MSSGAPRFGVIPVSCNREGWQSSDMRYPAVNDPNITSGSTFNKRSVSLASKLCSSVFLRPSPEQSAPSAVCYSMNTPSPTWFLLVPTFSPFSLTQLPIQPCQHQLVRVIFSEILQNSERMTKNIPLWNMTQHGAIMYHDNLLALKYLLVPPCKIPPRTQGQSLHLLI